MSGNATPIVPPIQPANHYALSGHGLHVDYATTSISGQRTLTYHDHTRSLSFSGNDIRVVDVPDIGSVVSVTLSITVDVGSTTFTVLIPPVTVSGIGGSAPVSTDGVTTMHKMPLGPQLNLGQRDLYHVTHLSGTANHILT
ncbi:MAG TPA: hypothetical protein VGC09_13685 [Rhodopila sp.]